MGGRPRGLTSSHELSLDDDADSEYDESSDSSSLEPSTKLSLWGEIKVKFCWGK